MSKNKYPEQTRQKIIDTALMLFEEKGFNDTTIQDIIDKMQMSKGAIYHHFKSKDEIILAVRDQVSRDDSNVIEDLIHNNELPIKIKISKIIMHLTTSERKKKLLDCVCLRNRVVLLDNVQSIERSAPLWETLIKQGIAEGIFKTDFPYEAAEVMMLLFNIWLDPLLFSRTFSQLSRKVDFLSHMLCSIGVPILEANDVERIKNFMSPYCKEL
jgi:AcrR family transcriptional regulator